MTSVDKPARAKWWMLASLVILLTVHGSTPVFSNEETGFPGSRPQPQFTEAGVEACLNCHQGEPIDQMSESAHGNLDNPHSPYATNGCESCHGPGSFHVSRARGGIGFPPLTSFRPRAESKVVQDQACTDCHENRMGRLSGIEWHGSVHQNIGMTCLSCHQLHVSSDPMRDRQQQNARCSQCHGRALEEHDRFEHAGIQFDELSCATCHDVHEY